MDQPWTSAEATRALAELFLKACALGAPCGDLATALAAAVVVAAGVRLAVDVLAGGEHQIARATELAGRVLDANRRETSTLEETVAEPAFRPLLTPIASLSPPVCKGHDPDFGVVVREDDAVGEALEDQSPIGSITDQLGSWCGASRMRSKLCRASSRSSPPRPSRRSSYQFIAAASSASALGSR